MKHWSAKREQWDHSAGRIGIFIKTKALLLITVFFLLLIAVTSTCVF